MILHVWVHWFWITVTFKYFLFVAVQLISLTCISHPSMAEAGLLDNETLIHNDFNLYKVNDSSQFGDGEDVTTVENGESVGNVTDANDWLTETTSPEPETSGSVAPDPASSTPEAAKNGTTSSTTEEYPLGVETSDVEDTYNGGNLDAYQYPFKELARYSQTGTGDNATDQDAGEKNVTLEGVKIVEKLNINISLVEAGGVEMSTDGNATESATPPTPTPTMDQNATANGVLAAEDGRPEDAAETGEPAKMEVVTVTANVSDPTNGTEVEKDVLEDTYRNESLVIENKVEESAVQTTVEAFPVKNRVAAATSAQNFDLGQSGMNAGSVTGITLGILVIFALFGAISFVLYRRRYLNKPQVFHDKCSNLDSSGYIDDASLRENSEEMYSLDNDSFLNSLEAMTIQNYWTENVKHTKL